MKRSVKGLMAMAAAFAMLSLVGISSADDTKAQTVKECMKCQQKVVKELNALVKAKDVKWDDVSEKSKTWLTAAEDMGKNKPKKGPEASWKEQSEKYLATVKAINEGAEKKDSKIVTAKLKEFGASCMACHSKHK